LKDEQKINLEKSQDKKKTTIKKIRIKFDGKKNLKDKTI
jgi:hypothetical protein